MPPGVSSSASRLLLLTFPPQSALRSSLGQDETARRRLAQAKGGSVVTRDQKSKPSWQELLVTAIKEPGAIHEAYSRFWNYSSGNQVLALTQCIARGIEPGPIASFQRWREFGRYVKKGEKALALIMPVTVKVKSVEPEHTNEPERQTVEPTRTIFILKRRWFVLSQTEGEPYQPAPIPEWTKDRALETLGLREEPFQELNGNIQGYARARIVSVSPLSALPHKTRFHEMAHVLLGHTGRGGLSDTESISKSLIEAEAESVALICCESLNLPGAEFSRGYIQHWLDGEEIPERSAQRIFAVADRILKAGLQSKG